MTSTTTITMESIWAQVDTLLNAAADDECKSDVCAQYVCRCGGAKVFFDADLPTCSVCGKVDDVFISDEAEWTSGIDGDGVVSDPSRCGAPMDTELFSENWGMSTLMQMRGPQATYTMKKLSRISFHSSMNHKDRSLFHAYKEFDSVKDTLGLSDAMIRTAKIMYKRFSENKLTRGSVRNGVKANCVFMACKEHNYPRTTKEIADAFEISTRDMGRTISLFTDVVITEEEPTFTKPRDVVVRIIKHIELGDNTKSIKSKIFKCCDRLENCVKLMGKTPTGVASAIVYTILSSEGIAVSKQTVCEAANISIPTLNKIETIVKQELR